MFEFVLAAGVTTFLWSVAIIAALGFITYFAETNSPGRASLIFLAMLITLQGLSPIQPFSMLASNPLGFIGVAILYVALGAGYGIVKWYSFVRNIRDQFLKARAEGIANSNVPLDQMSETQIEFLNRRAMQQVRPRVESLPPKIAANKARFTTWMCYWPMSAAWTVLNDPVRRIFNTIYDSLAEHLQSIANRAFGDIKVN